MSSKLNLAYPGAVPGNPYQEPRSWLLTNNDLYGPLALVTEPTDSPITLKQAKDQCRVDIDDEDPGFLDWIRESTEEAECMIEGHRQFCTATLDLYLRGWWANSLPMPRPPLRSVTSVKYYAGDGTLTTLASDQYEVMTPWRLPGRLMRKPNVSFPTLQCDREFPIIVRFSAGYDLDKIPGAAKSAVKLLVQARYQRDVDGDKLRKAAEDILLSLGGGYA